AQAARAAAKQALVEQRRQRVELCLADRFRRLERAAAAEHSELREQAPLVVVQQVVRPRDRRPQRGVALVGVPGSLEQVEPAAEALEQELRREQLRPRGRELERERKPGEPLAQPRDRLPFRSRRMARPPPPPTK